MIENLSKRSERISNNATNRQFQMRASVTFQIDDGICVKNPLDIHIHLLKLFELYHSIYSIRRRVISMPLTNWKQKKKCRLIKWLLSIFLFWWQFQVIPLECEFNLSNSHGSFWIMYLTEYVSLPLNHYHSRTHPETSETLFEVQHSFDTNLFIRWYRLYLWRPAFRLQLYPYCFRHVSAHNFFGIDLLKLNK